MATTGNTEHFTAGTAPRKDKGRKAVEKMNNVLGQLQVEYVPHDSIKPNAYNPNRQSEHDFELLCRSMEEDGFTQPIIVQQATRNIVDGEHRWRAAAKLGINPVPVVFVDMTDAQMKIATLRHNRARGSEDLELSAQVLKDLRELGALDYAQDSLMLDDVEMQRLLDDVPAPELLAAADYSSAWNPAAEGSDQSASPATTIKTANATEAVQSATPAAAQSMRQLEVKMATAKSEEERKQIQKDVDVYRVSLVFSGDEAATVRDVLGQQQAVGLLDLCKAELARRADGFAKVS